MDNVKYVVENSKYVKINKEVITNISNMIEKTNYMHWSSYNKIFKQFTEKEIILFSFILESLNFCFWSSYDWKIFYDNQQYIGSDALLYILLKSIENGKLKLDIDSLCKITKNDFNSMIKENKTFPKLMNERYESLITTVKTIKNNKNFWLELYSIKSADELELYIVNNFPNFKDEVIYKNKLNIKIYKCYHLKKQVYNIKGLKIKLT